MFIEKGLTTRKKSSQQQSPNINVALRYVETAISKQEIDLLMSVFDEIMSDIQLMEAASVADSTTNKPDMCH